MDVPLTDDGKVGPVEPLLEHAACSGGPPGECDEPDRTARERGQSGPVARTRGHRLRREPDPQAEGDEGGGEDDEVHGCGEPCDDGDHRDHGGTDEHRPRTTEPRTARGLPPARARSASGDADEPHREPASREAPQQLLGGEHGADAVGAHPLGHGRGADALPLPPARSGWCPVP